MQAPGAHAGGCCLHQPQVSGRQQKPLGGAAASAVFIINKTNARTGEIIREKAKYSGQGCAVGAGWAWRGWISSGGTSLGCAAKL